MPHWTYTGGMRTWAALGWLVAATLVTAGCGAAGAPPAPPPARMPLPAEPLATPELRLAGELYPAVTALAEGLERGWGNEEVAGAQGSLQARCRSAAPALVPRPGGDQDAERRRNLVRGACTLLDVPITAPTGADQVRVLLLMAVQPPGTDVSAGGRR